MKLLPAMPEAVITLLGADKTQRVVLRAGGAAPVELRTMAAAPICLRMDRFSIPLFASVITDL